MSNQKATSRTETEITAKWAAIDFQPWEHKKGEWTPPTNEEWVKLVNPHLINLRAAWILMFKSKDELIEMLRIAKNAETAGILAENIHETRSLSESFLVVLNGAEGRLFSADAALELTERKRPGRSRSVVTPSVTPKKNKPLGKGKIAGAG